MMPTPHPGNHPQRPARPYTRADAIADGLLIDVPVRLSRQFGFTWPLAISTLAWFDAISWDTTSEHSKSRPTGETESFRIAEVLWAAKQALTTHHTRTGNLEFAVYRVPPTGPETRSLRCTLQLTVHDGDHGETVATIAHPAPHVVARFLIINLGEHSTEFPAAGYEEDHDHILWPVVTPDTLDRILSEATRTRPGITISLGPDHTGAIHIEQPDTHPLTLRPDTLGRYHLKHLGWKCFMV